MRAFKLFIAENIPSLNKGEVTILEGMLESFKILGKVEVTMLSDRPEIDQPRYQSKIRVLDIRKNLYFFNYFSNQTIKICSSIFFLLQHLIFILLNKFIGSKTTSFMKSELWRVYTQSDAIVIGHNGSFGIGGGLGSPILFYSLFAPFFANMIDKPIIFYGGSIMSKPNKLRWFFNKAFKSALERMDLITLRDNDTYRNMKDQGFYNRNLVVTADPAFLLQPAPEEKIKDIIKREGIHIHNSTPLIGITVTREMACKAFSTLSHSTSYDKHNQVIAKVIDELTDKLNAKIIFLPHCIGFGDHIDDRIVAADIYQICKNKDKIKLVTYEYEAGELKGLIGQLDLFIGERLHSVINAMSMYVPSIIVSYSKDIRLDIIKMTGQENAIYHVDNLEADSLLQKINSIWSKKDDIKNALKNMMPIVKEKAMLNGKLLKNLMDSRKVIVEEGTN